MNDSVGRSRAEQQRIKVALVFGGRSSEHAISCVSAGSILRNLDQAVYEVVAVGVTPEGGWVLTDGDPAQLAISDRTLPRVTDASGTELLLATDPRRAGQLVNVDSSAAGQVLASVDVVFPVLHGPYGEDGTIQGLLELAGVPYVGAGVLASAAGMDKEFTKKLLAAEGLPIGKYAVIRPRDTTLTLDQREDLGLPVFVKPARAGSSFGVSRVTAWEELPAAIAHARQYDPKVIVEAAIVGRELECGVLEFPDGDTRASVLGEIRVEGVNRDQTAAGAFYDFETKYLDDTAELDVPAKVDDDVSDQIRELAVAAFRAIDCQGLARVDFFLAEDGPLINEINTMPGFTTISMYPRMWDATGVDYPTLLDAMVRTALARGTGLR
ncbi:Probable D-alanine--D-alanine ligase DdlA [Mycobacteroides abscessus subsp. abscessus]|uniref:D-alanine--D-alanine ligase family protein n=1 Tax=Mycobacteroides abscessus TaxID=36809 RepID=UPI000469D56A|nr:D-alanine--D-alanine ligase family protein [Mycobacteroides abscessus]MBE5497093.1 D-alanine-D-alanine ligase [Mycobacteroides abscessus]SHP17606.1 Probable D-alanine--D-alanine ligase DdlA [Mycobacteroides abscessus subsp. abscessus]SHP75916.1 Probable D-alanine--D-alanine ligase DdlA [Mycobacteroides abscessus subsp. abscessus]SHP87064.1 Probable D-alanine--D-alanine ligase DdlA [Mycobacteroides abscessus subsp. abscessus]SHQ56245.1 Probable D-alanine--D-alanine ligase DdlA [Mycobacteroid